MTYFERAKKKFEELKDKSNVKILAFESSCDETSVSIVENGRKILSNIVASQIDIHTRFGGVVPEVASRNHITAISNITKECLKTASLTFDDIDAVAVTYGAGLLGALLVGVNYAKSLAYALDLPLIAVNHIKGHIAANYLSHEKLEPPFICLMVSGGHTCLFDVKNYTDMELCGTTVDDAVGEAFDKVARVVGLGYPGGPKVDKAAKLGQNNINFVHNSSFANSYNFSFSGIKTAVINYVNKQKMQNKPIIVEDICASFQEYVVKELSTKAIRLCEEKKAKKLVVAGGVGANQRLKEVLQQECDKKGIELFVPVLSLCTDNAAMIGSSAFYELKKGRGLANLDLTAKPTVPLINILNNNE